MIGPGSLSSGRTCLLILFLVCAEFVLLRPVSSVFGAEPLVRLEQIEPPVDWNRPSHADRWMRASVAEWERFQNSLQRGGESSSSPVITDAVYRCTFDEVQLTAGAFDWKIERIRAVPGFVSLGRSSLAVSELRWPQSEAVQGITSTGEWVLWSEADHDRLTGKWSHCGKSELAAVSFELTLPRALSSRLEILVPAGWEARVLGSIASHTPPENSAGNGLWKFDLGRQQTIPLRLEKQKTSSSPRILVSENTVYGLTTTDDLIRMRTDLVCTVDGARDADLLLSAPKTLRVFNVLLGNELPLTFERELGTEEDQLRIPLRSMTPGQRVTLRILGESQRRSDRVFAVPRLRLVNGQLREGRVRVAVDRPLEVRTVETTGLRQTQQTEEEGQEIRSYDVLSKDCQLALQVGEPSAVLQGEMLFIADVRGESPTSRVRVRLSTREGELFSPQMLIPAGWDLISVEMAEASDIAPAAWQVTAGPAGDGLLDLELRQPIRPDRDCTLQLVLKAVALKPGTVHRLPIPQVRDVQNCYARGVVWDNWPWELDDTSSGSVELDGTAADEELLQAVKWTGTVDSQAVPTGVRIPVHDAQSKLRFRAEGSTPVDPGSVTGAQDLAPEQPLLCANLEFETRTSRVGKSHPHRALFQFTRPAIPGAFRLTLPLTAELTRILADEREISFVRQEAEVILDPSAKPFSELVLEYRTVASPGWIVSRDDVVFPQLDCFITEFAWHLVLDPERQLYRLPITAAVSPREQPRAWERLLGPLARHAEETLFNPFSRADWKSLINGTVREGVPTRSKDVWFVAPQIPERITMKTWNEDVSHGLAWCSFLGSLAWGVGLRRARHSLFRRGWIYLGGCWLVIAVFVAEPYAPIAGGAFLGCLLALIIPRRFVIRRDWLAEQRSRLSSPMGRAAVVTGLWMTLGASLLCPSGNGQEASPITALSFFEIQEQGETVIVFDAAFRSLWNNWRELESGPTWLLKSSHYEVQPETSGPPQITATYAVAIFGDQLPAALRLPLFGVSLDQAEGLIDGQPVRLIPAADGKGFVLPWGPNTAGDERKEKSPKTPPPPPATEPGRSQHIAHRTVTIKFRLLPESIEDSQLRYSASIPALPESVIRWSSDRWRMTAESGEAPPQAALDGACELGPVGRLNLSSSPPDLPPRENLTDLHMQTLAECGPLGARVRWAARAATLNPSSPAEFTMALPTGVFVESITGPTLDQSVVDYLDTETLVTVRLQPTAMEKSSPVEIMGFLPATPAGFQMAPPQWKSDLITPGSPDSTPVVRDENPFVGATAQPGFKIVDISSRASAAPISPQTYSESLSQGIAWRVPDLAWTCRDPQGPAWTLEPVFSSGRASLTQNITLKDPKSEWRLEATVSTTAGVPFEHRFTIDPRIEIQRAVVQQDGADRLLRWTRTGDQVQLSIRDGQPGPQSILMEGVISQGPGAWAPPICEYRSGQTADASVMIRNSPRVISTLRWADSTTRLRPHVEQSDEEVRYRPGTSTAPLTIRVEPVVEERSARAWVEFIPESDSTWQVTVRVQLKESTPFVAPVRIVWDQLGLSELRLTDRQDNVRQTASGKAFLWRPRAQSSKPAELSLSAAIDGESLKVQPLRLPQLSGVKWSEIWVSLPRGAGYRPARASSTLLSVMPTDWPAAWTESLSSSREDVYSCLAKDIPIEATSSEPLVRSVRVECLIWIDGAGDIASAARRGVDKYLLITERDITLKIPDSARPLIRAISVDGRLQSAETPVRVASHATDLSHEIVIWWQAEAGQRSDPGGLIEIPGSAPLSLWGGIILPHQQVLLDLWGSGHPLRYEFWLDRSETLLRAAREFQGAPWAVDGPLLNDVAESRDELSRAEQLTPAQRDRGTQIEQHWKTFSQSGGAISSPAMGSSSVTHDSGLDTVLSLCGESRSLWLSSSLLPSRDPRLLDRRWAMILTASFASLVSLLVLMWVVRIFRQLDLSEQLAARPHAAMAAMGLIWWACLSPSVLGLGLALLAGGLWIWERITSARTPATTAANRPA